MGASNIASAFAYWRQKLTPQHFIALVHMALVAKDSDQPPRYWGTWQDIAKAMGHEPGREDEKAWESARKLEERAIRALVRTGVIVSTKAASKEKGIRAEYALALEPDRTWRCVRLEKGAEDGIVRGVWEPSLREQMVPTQGNKSFPVKGTDGSSSGNKSTGPRSSQEPDQEQSQDNITSQSDLTSARAREEAERQRQMAELEQRMGRAS
ncbi:hypothetical protein [Sinomonas sp. P10A9]|uniref:Helix-turn-helix protein n=1 Tax=Sinomonas puerhi TaxID=3238584 RepID=A0AB39L0E6_9MICC